MCALQLEIMSLWAILYRVMWRSPWIKTSASHAYTFAVDVFGHLVLSSSCTIWSAFVKFHESKPHLFCDITFVQNVSTHCRWISDEIFVVNAKPYHTSCFNWGPSFSQRNCLLTEIQSCYWTASSIYQFLLSSLTSQGFSCTWIIFTPVRALLILSLEFHKTFFHANIKMDIR